MKRPLAALVVFATGLFAATVLTFPATALAWDWHQLPAGYAVSNHTTICHIATDPCVDGEGSTCNHLTIHTQIGVTFSETDCVNPNFQQHLDAYVDSTICRVNPAAGGQACIVSTSTTTAAGTTSETPPAGTTTTAGPGETTPATTPTVTVTTTVTTTVADPTLEARLTALEQRNAANEARIAELEAQIGLILGEPKNVEPFTAVQPT